MKLPESTDKHIKVVLLHAGDVSLAYQAMRQDRLAEPVHTKNLPPDPEQVIVDKLLSGQRGHYGCLEHVPLTVNVVGFPHEVMQQITRHRVGHSFDVQSFRVSGEAMYKEYDHFMSNMRSYTSEDSDRLVCEMVEKYFYFRPPGTYRYKSTTYTVTPTFYRYQLLHHGYPTMQRYYDVVNATGSHEHARSSALTYNARQHFVWSMNLRSLMHVLDLRYKPDCQYETQLLSSMLLDVFEGLTPKIAAWYNENRKGKAVLSP